MAEPIADLKVTVSADTAAAEAGLRRYSALLDKTAQQAAALGKAAPNTGADRMAAAELAANAKVEAARISSASRVEAATVSANQRAAASQVASQSRVQAAELNGNARVVASETSAVARLESQRLAGVSRVQSAELAANSRVEAARLASQAKIQIAQERAAQKPAPSSFGLGQTAGALGIGVGIAGAVQAGLGALKDANSLDRTKATVEALSGSTQRYQQVLSLAQQGQAKYGGTLQANLAPLGTLVNLSNRTSVALGDLDNVARRLAIVDPVQGFEGANLALKEFFSGTGAEAALSLVKRFELPKSALRELTKEGMTAEEKMAGLNRVLNEAGITNKVLAAQVDTDAAAYTRLAATFDNARVAFGKYLAERLKAPAEGATNALASLTGDAGPIDGAQGANDAVRGVAEMQVFGVQLNSVTAGVGAYNEAVLGSIERMLELTGLLQQQATPAEIANAQATTDASDRHTEAAAAVTTAADALRAQTAELEANAVQSLLTDANGQLLAATQADLQAQASAAADAILYGGEVGVAAAAKLANASPLVQQLTDAYIRLRKAQLSDQGFEDQRAGERSGGRFGSAEESKRIKDLERAAAANQKLVADAQRRLQETVGGTPTKLANAQNDLKKLLPGTQEYYDKLTEIETLKQQAAKPARGAGSAQSARDRNAVAGQDIQAQIDYWKKRRDALAKGSKEWLKADTNVKNLEAKQAKAGHKNAQTAADKDLRLDTANAGAAEELARYREELQRLDKSSDKYAATLRKIEDLELKVADARNKAQLSRVDDQIKRMEEDRALASARRAVNSNETTTEQKQRARLEIERITLDREGRQIDIAKVDKEAGINPATKQAIASAVSNGVATNKDFRTGAMAGVPYGEGMVSNGFAKSRGDFSVLPVSQGANYLERSGMPMSAFPVLPAASVVHPTPSVVVNNQVSNFIDGRELLRGIRTEISTQIQNAVEDNLQQSYDQSVRSQPQGVR